MGVTITNESTAIATATVTQPYNEYEFSDPQNSIGSINNASNKHDFTAFTTYISEISFVSVKLSLIFSMCLSSF